MVDVSNNRWFITCDCGANVEVAIPDDYSWIKACNNCGDTIQVWEDGTYSINNVDD